MSMRWRSASRRRSDLSRPKPSAGVVGFIVGALAGTLVIGLSVGSLLAVARFPCLPSPLLIPPKGIAALPICGAECIVSALSRLLLLARRIAAGGLDDLNISHGHI